MMLAAFDKADQEMANASTTTIRSHMLRAAVSRITYQQVGRTG